MWRRGIMTLVMAMAVLPLAEGYSTGAGSEACSNLTPSHGKSPQTSTSPYNVTFTPQTYTAGGGPITVTLAGSNFMGFMLTTQYVDSSKANVKAGSLNLPTNTQYMCSDDVAVTHTLLLGVQNSLTFQWTPPATSQGNVRFRATFVQSKDVYWVDVWPTHQLVDSATGSDPVLDVKPTPGAITKDAACGQTKGCFSKCSGSNCDFLVTWSEGTSNDNVAFTFTGTVGSDSSGYIALGLSSDQRMGDDSVTYCVNDDASPAYNAYNVGKSNRQLTKPTEGLASQSASLTDGVLTCSFTRAKAADSSGERFDLSKQYTLFFAIGSGSTSSIGIHGSLPLVSGQAVSLVDYTVDVSTSALKSPMIKAHGSLMMIAWVFFASIGIVMARYFKNSWSDTTWFSQKVWFQIHRGCMVLVLVCTVASFIIIFVEVGGYSEIQGEGYKKAHPILGIIVTALTVINPIMALFRPHPGTEYRPIFNWLHWGVGSAAHILGVIAIFFGLLLEKSGAPDYTIYIMVAFVAWDVLISLLLELTQCMGRSSGNKESYEMSDMAGGRSGNKGSDSQESLFNKKLLLGLHVMVMVGFIVALVVVLNVGEEEDDHDH